MVNYRQLKYSTETKESNIEVSQKTLITQNNFVYVRKIKLVQNPQNNLIFIVPTNALN